MIAYQDGSGVIGQNPHPAFDKLVGRGYKISYRIEQEVEPFKDLLVRVMHGNSVIADADFTDDGFAPYCQNVRVDPKYQRQGVATAIFVFAEKVLGKSLHDFWGDDSKQTPEAKALWAQPKRPFGHPPRS